MRVDWTADAEFSNRSRPWLIFWYLHQLELKRPATVVILVEPVDPINVDNVDAAVHNFEVRNCLWSGPSASLDQGPARWPSDAAQDEHGRYASPLSRGRLPACV